MKAAVLAVVLLLLQALGGRAAPAEPAVSAPLVAAVLESALSFIEPRTLEAVSLPQLTIWGLRGLTALDPALAPELRDGRLRLVKGGELVFDQAAPPDTAAGWGAAAAEMARAAAAVSDPVQDAGSQGVLRSVFDELFNHLDPYSRYVGPDRLDRGRATRSGEASAGLQLALRGGAIVVASVAPDSPAAALGIRRGDRLLAVDGQPTRGVAAAEAATWLQGPEGTLLRLQLADARGRIRTRTLEIASITPPTVFASRSGTTLVVRISAFGRDTEQQLARALGRGLQGMGRRSGGIVLDLRGNRGGLLRQAVAATDLLLDGGVVAITAGRNEQASNTWSATGQDVSDGRPVVVLVDGRSASAAEIMAAGLADLGRAVVVGSSTLGKGLVQTIAVLPDGGELFVTWSRVLAPAGWPLQGLGVLPQVCTSMGQAFTDDQMAALLAGQQLMGPALALHHSARAPLPAAKMVELRNACPAAAGRDGDMAVARRLLASPAAYAAALLVPPTPSEPHRAALR